MLRGPGSLPRPVTNVLGYLHPTKMTATVQYNHALVHELKHNPEYDRNPNPPTLARISAERSSTFHLILLPPEGTISWIRALAINISGPCRLHLRPSPTPPLCHPPQNMVFLNYLPRPQQYGATPGQDMVNGASYIAAGYSLNVHDLWRRNFIVLVRWFLFYQIAQVLLIEYLNVSPSCFRSVLGGPDAGS